MVADARKWRESMVEAAAEASEDLMNRYLEEGDLPEADILRGLRLRTIAGEIQPMLCGSAFKNKGVQRLLDAAVELMPSPLEVPPVEGHPEDGSIIVRHADDSEKFSALADRKSTRLNSSHQIISYAVFCLKKKNRQLEH